MRTRLTSTLRTRISLFRSLSRFDAGNIDVLGTCTSISAILRDEPKPIERCAAGSSKSFDAVCARTRLDEPSTWTTSDSHSTRFAKIPRAGVWSRRELRSSGASCLDGVGRRPRHSWWWRRSGRYGLSRAQPVPVDAPIRSPLTTYPGGEINPSFSPDGRQVVFTWNGEKRDNLDIYVKMVDGGNPLRLTTDPAPIGSPNGLPMADMSRSFASRPSSSYRRSVEQSES